jgi:hypothetical protein
LGDELKLLDQRVFRVANAGTRGRALSGELHFVYEARRVAAGSIACSPTRA